MTITKLYAPTVTLLARPVFFGAPGVEVAWQGEASDAEHLCEFAGRACYQSWANPSGRTTAEYLANILAQGHGSVLEHASVSLYLQGVSRSLTHELIRHHAGTAVSQLSQRYVDEGDCAFVVPPAVLDHPQVEPEWAAAMHAGLRAYAALATQLLPVYAHLPRREQRIAAREAARSVLPNATETKLVFTANLRAWRHVLGLRGAPEAEREVRRLMVACVPVLKRTAPAVLADVEVFTHTDGHAAVRVGAWKV